MYHQTKVPPARVSNDFCSTSPGLAQATLVRRASRPRAVSKWRREIRLLSMPLENAGAGQVFVLTDQISRSRILTSVTT